MIAALCLARITAPWGKLVLRERNTAEHLTGIFPAAGILTAHLGGDTIVQNRHQKLGIPFQTNNGKLSQCDQQISVNVTGHQFFFKQFRDSCRNLRYRSMTAVLLNFGTKHHGVQHFHH